MGMTIAKVAIVATLGPYLSKAILRTTIGITKNETTKTKIPMPIMLVSPPIANNSTGPQM